MKKKSKAQTGKTKKAEAPAKQLRVLLIEDVEDDALLIVRELKKGGYMPEFRRVETITAMKEALKKEQWDIILCDYALSKFNAPQVLRLLREIKTDIPVIIVSGAIGEETAADCMVLGARDFIWKNNLSRLCPAVARELHEARTRATNQLAEKAMRESEERFSSIFRTSPVAIALTRMRDNILMDVNESWVEITGYSKVEAAGHSTKEFNLWIEPATRQKMIESLQKQGVAKTEVKIRRKTGEIKNVLMLATIINMAGENHLLTMAQDITDREQAEKDLLESERKYRALIDSAAESIFIMKDCLFVDCNAETLKMFSCSKEGIIGCHPGDWSPEYQPDGRLSLEKAEDKMGMALRGTPQFFEWTHRRMDGTPFDTEVSLKRVELGSEMYLQAIVRDITVRKQAEEALRESEEKYRLILENIQEGYYEVDLSGNITFFNNAMALIADCPPEELMGMNYRFYTPEKNLKKVFATFNHVFHSGNPTTAFDWEIIRTNGEVRHIEASASLLKDAYGKPKGFRGLVRDITEKKQMEDERQESLEALRKALGATINAMAVTVETRDPYTAGHQRRVAHLARAIATEMKLSSEQIDAVRMASVIHDIGKISIPSEILTKPTQLSELEYNLIKTHPSSGHSILKDIEFPWPIARIVLEHHERINGSGYPCGLKGEEILLESRIVAVADVVEATSSHRPYRAAHGIETGLQEIEKNKGNLYDRDVVDACLRLFREKHYNLDD